MNNLTNRLLTTIIGVPAVVCLLILLPQMNHLAFAVVAVVCCSFGTFEMSRMLFGKVKWYHLVPASLPVIQYLELYLNLSINLTDVCFVSFLLLYFFIEVFRGSADDFKQSCNTAAKFALLCIYPGYLGVFVIKILAFVSAGKTGGWLFLLMILLVFSNDIFAYVFGRLFGKNNGGLFKVSPHKSVAGFIGGAVVCIVASFGLCFWLFDDISILESLLLGFGVSLTANAGDLIESMFKRSAGVKDSGKIIPGRGGMLDCLDSILATAPVFFLILEIVA